MVAYAINERMARRIEYLLEKFRVLREVYTETTGRKHILFTDEHRRQRVAGIRVNPDNRWPMQARPSVSVCAQRYRTFWYR